MLAIFCSYLCNRLRHLTFNLICRDVLERLPKPVHGREPVAALGIEEPVAFKVSGRDERGYRDAILLDYELAFLSKDLIEHLTPILADV